MPIEQLFGFKDLTQDAQEIRRRLIASASPKERLAGLAPSDRLAGLAPEEMKEMQQLLALLLQERPR